MKHGFGALSLVLCTVAIAMSDQGIFNEDESVWETQSIVVVREDFLSGLKRDGFMNYLHI
jgi:hypothetical protein